MHAENSDNASDGIFKCQAQSAKAGEFISAGKFSLLRANKLQEQGASTAM